MTELLFGGAAFILMGYLIGKLFVRFNPFLILLGGLILLATAPIMLQLDNKNFATVFFVLGIVLNFNRPLTYVRNLMSDAFSTFKLSRSYVSNLEEQKEEFERDLYEQKRQVEEDLKRQKYEAQQDIERQRREVEETLKQEAEKLRRDKERYSREQKNNHQNRSQKQSYSNQSSHSQSNSSNRHLNPLVFTDACEVLGLSQGRTLKEYKAAYLKLMKLYHSDKLTGLPDQLRRQEEEKAKILNVAIGTIKKKLR